MLCSLQLNHVHVNTLSCYSVTKKASCARDCKIEQHNVKFSAEKLHSAFIFLFKNVVGVFNAHLYGRQDGHCIIDGIEAGVVHR